MQLSEIIKYSGSGILLLMTLIQITPVKINPWSKIANWIGRALTTDLTKEIKEQGQELKNQSKQISLINQDIVALKKDINESQALNWRQTILDFDDELDSRSTPPTKEHFDNILEVVDSYNRYCINNPDFPNSKAQMAVEHLKNTYRDLKDKNGFKR